MRIYLLSVYLFAHYESGDMNRGHLGCFISGQELGGTC